MFLSNKYVPSKWLLWTVRDTMLVPPFRVGGQVVGCPLPHCLSVCVSVRERERQSVCVFVFRGGFSPSLCVSV